MHICTSNKANAQPTPNKTRQPYSFTQNISSHSISIYASLNHHPVFMHVASSEGKWDHYHIILWPFLFVLEIESWTSFCVRKHTPTPAFLMFNEYFLWKALFQLLEFIYKNRQDSLCPLWVSHLGNFHIFAFTNNSVMNILKARFLPVSFLLCLASWTISLGLFALWQWTAPTGHYRSTVENGR